MRLSTLPAVALAASTLLTPAVHAQQTIEEVVVTADYRHGTLLEVPMSVTVIGRDQIAARNAEHLEDVLAMAPNVNLSNGASRARFYQIRGIGERGQFAEPLNSSVGLIIDGVDFSGVGSAALLFDVDQVEVLRGPQSTRYGANALAGLINVTTRAPTDTPEYALSVEAGNYGTWGVSALASGPLGERAGYRLGVQQRSSDGFIENTFLNTDDTNDRNERVLRGRLDWAASEALDVSTTLAWIDVDNGYDAFSLDNDRDTRSDQPGQDVQESLLWSTRASLRTDAGVRLEGLVGFADSASIYSFDEDWTFVGFHPAGFSSFDRYERDRRTLSGEVRAMSTADTRLFGGRTDWTLGLYAIDTDVDLQRTYTFLPGPFSSSFDTRRMALFGQLQSAIAERLTLTTGVRVEHRRAAYDDSDAASFDPDEVLVGGRAALDFGLTDSLTTYVNLARGFKAGGFNTDGSLDTDLREFDAETLWAIELGVKGLVAGGRLAMRLAAFHMRRDDVQISSSIVRVRADGSSEFIDFTGNAAAGFNRGVEAEFDWYVSDRLTLFAAMGLLDTEYQNFVNAAGSNLGGRDQAHAPNYQFHMGGQLDLARGFRVRLEFEGRDAFFFSDAHDARSGAYELLHASAGWQAGQWSVNLFARNLTDAHYATRGFHFGNDPRTGFADNTWTQLGEPRRFGLRLQYRTGG